LRASPSRPIFIFTYILSLAQEKREPDETRNECGPHTSQSKWGPAESSQN